MMANPERAEIDLQTASGDELVRAMNRGVRDALLAHKRAGLPIVTWDYATEQVVIVPPEQIVVLDASTE